MKTIYDGNTGLSIMINLYVIKYFYYHVDKASRFITEKGRKEKVSTIYSTAMLPVSRQRLNRISKGEHFEFTREQANTITETYGIDIKYFRKDDPIAFKIDGIDEMDWKCFYNANYYGQYTLTAELRKDITKIEEKASHVEKTLKQLSKKWESAFKKSDPLYAICHYFHHGERFNDPDMVESLKELYKKLDYNEWDKKDTTLLDEMEKLMREHLNYIHSLTTIRKTLQKKKQIPKQ